MSVLNIGSINIDYVYLVPSLTKPGETITSLSLETFNGGKGLNQSVALARAGAKIYHAGCIGTDGRDIKEFLNKEGVDVKHILELGEGVRTGHAIIQVSSKDGENNIVLYGGANRLLNEAQIEDTLVRFLETDKPKIVLVQNETNLTPHLLETASTKGLITIWNPAPCPRETLSQQPLLWVDILILNESEGQQLTGLEEPMSIICEIKKHCKPSATIILTLGARGLLATSETSDTTLYNVEAVKVNDIVDTTAAGDTFVGYFTAGLALGYDFIKSLRLGTAAAALCIQRRGASTSIPRMSDIKGLEEIVIREVVQDNFH